MPAFLDWLSLAPQPNSFWDSLLRLGVAALAGGFIGFNRELSDRPAGLRTNMLVSLAAALFTVTSLKLVESATAAGGVARADPVRVVEAVTAGVAFIAAGTIIRAKASVQGVTTAAALWLSGAAGVACGVGAFDLAGASVILAVVILWLVDWIAEDTIKATRKRGGGPARAKPESDARDGGRDRPNQAER
ncbi:MAG: MgtC/SapB family protein [Oceanicaulis sp.]